MAFDEGCDRTVDVGDLPRAEGPSYVIVGSSSEEVEICVDGDRICKLLKDRLFEVPEGSRACVMKGAFNRVLFAYLDSR